MSDEKNWFSKARVETFSDGVFAIIVTLLVLEIKVPHIENHDSVSELAHALRGLLPKFLSWVMSFMMVCVIWVNHHRLFESIKEITHGIFWTNALLLLIYSLSHRAGGRLFSQPDGAVFFRSGDGGGERQLRFSQMGNEGRAERAY